MPPRLHRGEPPAARQRGGHEQLVDKFRADRGVAREESGEAARCGVADAFGRHAELAEAADNFGRMLAFGLALADFAGKAMDHLPSETSSFNSHIDNSG